MQKFSTSCPHGIFKVNNNNIDLVISELEYFVKPYYYWDKLGNEEFVDEIKKYFK